MSAFNYANLSANGATTLSTAPVLLHSVVVNALGAASNTLTLSDGANTIATIDTTQTGMALRLYDVQCRSGLTATLATGTAANVTICFG